MDQFQGDYEDQIVSCKDCGQEFVFSAGEQAFFAQKGFLAPPKRCKTCRDKKKAEGPGAGGGGGGGGMGGDRPERRFRSSGPVEVQERPAQRFRPRDDNGGGRGGGGGGGGGRSFDGGGGGSRSRVEVQCSQCGVMTTVPFEPAAGRPVYCRNCYQQKRGG